MPQQTSGGSRHQTHYAHALNLARNNGTTPTGGNNGGGSSVAAVIGGGPSVTTPTSSRIRGCTNVNDNCNSPIVPGRCCQNNNCVPTGSLNHLSNVHLSPFMPNVDQSIDFHQQMILPSTSRGTPR